MRIVRPCRFANDIHSSRPTRSTAVAAIMASSRAEVATMLMRFVKAII